MLYYGGWQVSPQKKAQVRVFLDGVHLKVVDDLIGAGYGGTRSEVIRTMVHDWVRDNIVTRRELLKLREEAAKGGYVRKK